MPLQFKKESSDRRVSVWGRRGLDLDFHKSKQSPRAFCAGRAHSDV